MSAALICAAIWVIVGAITAMLPMRQQMIPGISLLITAPILLVWIGYLHGWIWVALALLAFLSMMRNPLIYFWKRARGIAVELPPELRK